MRREYARECRSASGMARVAAGVGRLLSRLPDRLALPLVAAICLGLAAPGMGAEPGGSHPLIRSTQRPQVAGVPAVVFSAILDVRSLDPAAWEDRLAKIRRGGFTAVYLAVPWDVGAEGALQTADLRALLKQVKEAGMKAIVAPGSGAGGDCAKWLSVILPSLQKHAEAVLWLQGVAGTPGDAQKLGEAAKFLECAIPVADGSVASVASGPDPMRPYREPAVGIALRSALSEGATSLVWGEVFAGLAPPLPSAGDAASAVLLGPARGALPIGYYEARLFGQVISCLGAPLAEARPVGGSGSDGKGITVSQRNAGKQGFLFVQAPEDPARGFHLTFTDPATGEKLTVPRTEGLGLRTFGAGARVLPLNLPVPGATIRYCTGEVYGVYRVGDRTAILLTDDDGAPNEIALKMDSAEKPRVGGSPVEPLWDAKSQTLTVGYVPTFAETYTTVGDGLVLVVVPTERAQRTWTVPLGDTPAPMITGAYFVGDSTKVEDKLGLPVLVQQGKSAVTMLLDRKPRYLAVNRSGPKVAYTPQTGAFFFYLESPVLLSAQMKTPVVQVLDRARFNKDPGPAAGEAAQPDLDDSKWPDTRFDKAKGAGWYRAHFKLPALPEWVVPWKATFQITGKITVYLNGKGIGSVESAGETGGFVDLSLPDALLRGGADERNVLAFAVDGTTVIQKVGIAPYMEHAVERQLLIFFP